MKNLKYTIGREFDKLSTQKFSTTVEVRIILVLSAVLLMSCTIHVILILFNFMQEVMDYTSIIYAI